MIQSRKRQRRATVLLMVVSLLALLFVIVTGFLAVARFQEQVQTVVRKGDVREQIVESVENVVIGKLADSIRGEHGVLGGDPLTSPETIPGYRFNPVLGTVEPVWEEDYVPAEDGFDFDSPASRQNLVDFAKLRWPAVLSLDASSETRPEPRSVILLMAENELDNNTKFGLGDLAINVRNAWFDADGDGVPDTDLALAALLTEMANAAAGVTVSVPAFDRVDRDAIDDPGNPRSALFATQRSNEPQDAQGHSWRRFLESARYIVAARAISHGGMIALDAARVPTKSSGDLVPWNRRFITELFDRLRHPNDSDSLSKAPPAQLDEFFEEVAGSRASVERVLRSRWLLPQADVSAIPPVLAKLEGAGYTDSFFQFPETLVPVFPQVGRRDVRSTVRPNGELWQRFNLADERILNQNERTAWARAAARRPAQYDDLFRDRRERNDEAYARRKLVTTISNSDLVARKQNPAEPPAVNTGPLPVLATYRGELKFYLGEVNKAFDWTGNGWRYNPNVGGVIIGQLARLYRDMLDPYYDPTDSNMSSWKAATSSPVSGSGDQAVSINQQAYMLAVNTVAFAAPRDPAGSLTPGWIDNVVYSVGQGTFVGYVPQPFLTEAIASRVSADVGGNQIDAIALGVELFNPQDFSYDPTNPQQDLFALNLSQYRVRLASGVMNAPWDSDPLNTLAVGGTAQRPDADRMNGRTFLAFALEESSDNSVFTDGGVTSFTGTDSTGMTGPPNFDAAAEKIRVQLQRLGKDGVWRTVDQMLLDVPGANNYTFEVRDTSPTRLFGPPDFNLDGQPDDVNGDGVPEPFARWNVVMSLEPDDGTSEPTASTLGNASYVTDSAGVSINPDASLLNVPKAPMTPLITMNAEPLNDLMMFGNPDDLRPRSFPTVGFLLFVPRFSHYATASQAITLSETLARQWENQMGSGHAAYKVVPDPTKSLGQTIVADYPIDFGHMPVFDNSTPVREGSYLSKVSGEHFEPLTSATARGVGLPWGLLVFDYFTTLNPHAEDVDPYRVPGLIDINAASWNVLAELPLMGPFAPYNQVAPAIGERQQLPLRWYASSPSIIRPVPSLADPSPSFWDPFVGVLTGMAAEQVDAAEGPNFDRRARLFHGSVPGVTTGGRMLPEYDTLNTLDNGQYRLGGWLSQAVASYRDGIRYIANSMSGSRYRLSYLRGGFGVAPNPGQNVRPPYRNGDLYAPKLPGWPSPMNIAANVPGGGVRGADRGNPDDGRPEDFGFITLGELLNVQGFDSTLPQDIDNSATPYPYSTPLIEFQLRNTTLSRGDFVKAVSLMALLDTQVLTTRSNTFTVYASVIDREDPSASIRTQVTLDRSNLLPRLQYVEAKIAGSTQRPIVPKLVNDGNGGAIPIQTFNDDAQPTVIARRRAAYFNARYDN